MALNVYFFYAVWRYLRLYKAIKSAIQSARGFTATLRYVALSVLYEVYLRCMYAYPKVAILQIPLLRRKARRAGQFENRKQE